MDDGYIVYMDGCLDRYILEKWMMDGYLYIYIYIYIYTVYTVDGWIDGYIL